MLNSKGEVQEEFIEKAGNVVVLEATLVYQDYEFVHQQGIHVRRKELSQEEMNMNLLYEEILHADVESIELENLALPKNINGIEVLWERGVEYRGVYIILLGILMVVLLLFKKKEEIKEKQDNIKERIELEYPQIISSFLLYMGAGMTAKKCWEQIIKTQEGKGDLAYVYEEMTRASREMNNGKSELEAYQDFGLRMDSLMYRKFSLLLVQNVKKGTKGMVEILEREAQEAFDMRKRKAQKMGEEAGTKLLLPMFLMLSVVLCIVIVPAFLSVQL